MKLPSSGIRRILPRRIWQQIFFLLVFFAIIPLGALGFFLLNASQGAIKTAILRGHKEIAVHTTGEIREHVKGARETLLVTASILGTLHADPWRQETVVVELSLKNPAFQRISSLNLKGEEIATSQLGTELRDRSREQAFRKAVLGESYLSEVKISDNRIPFLTLAEPIRQFGKVQGVLIADLNVRNIWDTVDGIQVGRLGKAYLINQQGRIIAHHDKKKVLKNAGLTQPQVMHDILSGQAGNLEEIGERGESWLVSYAPVGKLNWGLIIARPKTEAFAFLREMNARSLIVIALSLLAALLISLILTRYMSRPMNDMIQGTQRVSRGDFSHFFQVHGKSEIDKLLFSFNRMIRKLRKAQEDEKLAVIGKAATAIAHELKNSLQLIDTFIKLLPQRQGDKQFIKELSDTIPRELDSWNASLKNMMTYSRDAGFPVKEIDANEIVREIALLTKFKARQSDIRLEVALEDIPLWVMGNQEKLKQVLLNIVTNALEATPQGGQIVLRSRLSGGFGSKSKEPCFAEIEIINTGEGIERNQLDKIFEPFYTTKTGGLGLGLSISKEIMDRHHGKIEVVSIKNETTSFIVRIPAVSTVFQRNAPGHSRGPKAIEKTSTSGPFSSLS
ncbi:MAG: HAMP domain-containing protein [Candidatus Omnitrophica bacterium]|nr:HAMP domain-containing protein [Candidatus Omnitrophota bacterium]